MNGIREKGFNFSIEYLIISMIPQGLLELTNVSFFKEFARSISGKKTIWNYIGRVNADFKKYFERTIR